MVHAKTYGRNIAEDSDVSYQGEEFNHYNVVHRRVEIYVQNFNGGNILGTTFEEIIDLVLEWNLIPEDMRMRAGFAGS